MNLHGLVRNVIQIVNPDIPVTVLVSNGYTTDGAGVQIPTYDPPVTVMGQVQELTTTDLRKLDNLNVQGSTRAVYLYGDWRGIMKETKVGQDLLQFNGETWLVMQILEAWPNWSKISICLQHGGS